MTNTEKNTNKRELFLRIVLILMGLLYLVVLAKFLFFKDGLRMNSRALFLRPFLMVREYRMGEKSFSFLLINYLGNIGLFVPFGILLPAIFKKLNYLWVLLIGLFTIITVESLQYFLSCGYTDIDDVILNTLGVIIGAGIFFLLFGGRRDFTRAQMISLVFLLIFAAVCGTGVWLYRPNMLPPGTVVYDNQIAGENLDAYDIHVFCYKMSHGQVFVRWEDAEDKAGNKIEDAHGDYYLADTAVFVREDVGGSYKIAGIDEMIRAVTDSEGCNVRLWLNEDFSCRMVLLERAEEE